MTQTTIGTVYLTVADLERLLTFYQDIIGLQVHRHEGQTAYLGVGGDDLLVLTENQQAQRVQGSTGLYHFAILVPTRYDLARSLQRIAETQTPIQGLSDHFVSEAIYLADPEGNGIEIYRDRPREQWYQNGEFRMGTVAMDVNGVMSELNGSQAAWSGLHEDTIMGHIHLHVSDIAQSEAFYRDLLDFDIMVNMHSASFMSYDGYHHHLGANIWAGRVPPPDGALGLDRYIIHVADQEKLDAILGKLEAAGIEIATSDAGYVVRDPSRNGVVLSVI